MVNWYAWPVALGGAVAVTYFVYGSQWKNFKPLLRFLGTFLVLFLTFGPSWNAENTFQRKPLIYIFTDASASTKKQSLFITGELKKEILNQFGSDLRLKQFYFGSEVVNSISDSIGFSTRLDKVTEFIKQEPIQPEACIFITDGISNRGGSPLMNQVQCPIFALATGDPRSYPDASILSLTVNESVFKGNDFEAEATIQTELLRGKNVVVDFFQRGRLLESKTYIAQRDLDIQRLIFKGKGEVDGLNELEVKVRAENIAEKNLYNNVFKSIIEVVAEKKKIVFLYQAVHPDLGAIRSALSGVEKFEITECKNIVDIPNDAHLVVAYNVKNDVFEALKKTKLPFWLFSDAFNQFTGEMAVSNRAAKNNTQAVTPEVNAEFNLFNLEALSFPFKSVDCPLLKLNVPREKIQIFQQWNRVNTNLPLCYVDESDVRAVYFLGFGIWKWRIQEMKQTSESKWFDQWVRSNIDWLSNQKLKEKNIEWSINKRNWQVGLQSKFKFSLFDGASSQVQNAIVSCTVIDPFGKKQRVGITHNLGMFSGVYRPGSSGRHTLNVELKKPIPGINQREFQQVFDVDSVSLEMRNTKANHQLLQLLSNQTQGGFYIGRSSGIDSVMNEIRRRELDKPRIEILQSRVFANDEAVILCIIILLFGIEWFLRKWEGKI